MWDAAIAPAPVATLLFVFFQRDCVKGNCGCSERVTP